MKYSVLALPLALMLTAGTVSAAEPIQKQASFVGNIPTEFFLVMDVGGWWGKNHELNWLDGEGFQMFKQRLLVKSTVGPITAHLTLPPQMTSATDEVIDMQMRVGGKTLSELPQEIANAEEALRSLPLDFELSMNPSALPKPGDYSGVFGLMFETRAPL